MVSRTEPPAMNHGAATPVLELQDLSIHYGRAHAVQGVTLAVHQGVLAVVGRNGMGKSSVCNAVMGLVPSQGRILLAGQQIRGLAPHEIVHRGIAYVPQGRRVWPSLTVHEHLQLAARSGRRGDWTIDRVYEVFPRLTERRQNGGAQLSGGEQQMLAIGRALLLNPTLLVMDEPTEGLAPVIVDQVAQLLSTLAAQRRMAILLVEQNIGVALQVADDVAVLVNGRVAACMPAAKLARDPEIQQSLLGVRSAARPRALHGANA